MRRQTKLQGAKTITAALLTTIFLISSFSLTSYSKDDEETKETASGFDTGATEYNDDLIQNIIDSSKSKLNEISDSIDQTTTEIENDFHLTKKLRKEDLEAYYSKIVEIVLSSENVDLTQISKMISFISLDWENQDDISSKANKGRLKMYAKVNEITGQFYLAKSSLVTAVTTLMAKNRIADSAQNHFDTIAAANAERSSQKVATEKKKDTISFDFDNEDDDKELTALDSILNTTHDMAYSLQEATRETVAKASSLKAAKSAVTAQEKVGSSVENLKKSIKTVIALISAFEKQASK